MTDEKKVAAAAEEQKAKFEVVKPLRHKGKEYAPESNVMLTEAEALLLVRDGVVKVASKSG